MKSTFFAAAVASVLAAPAFASDPSSVMAQFVRDSVMAWASDPAIVDAVLVRNSATNGLAEAEILELDTQWRAEVGAASSPTIDSVLNQPASDFIRSQVSGSGGAITEVIIMDAVGLNVAASGVTSDYWQGDEAKFQQTHSIGPDAIHVSEIELDESTQSYQAQVSFTLNDPATGAPIGAVTVGLNAEQFF